MKYIALALSLFIASAQAAKMDASGAPNKTDIRIPIKNFFKKNNKNFRIGIATGSLETNVRGRLAAQSGYTGEDSENENKSTNYQLHFGYEDIKTKALGYSIFGIYQDMNIVLLDEGRIRNMRLAGNATYGLNDQLYTYGGLNWGKYYGNGEVESDIGAGIGYQAGLGIKLLKKVNIEFEYLSLRNEGRMKMNYGAIGRQDTNVDITAKGLMLKVNTPFTFAL